METLKTGEGFSSFILEHSPFFMGHQDQDLRYNVHIQPVFWFEGGGRSWENRLRFSMAMGLKSLKTSRESKTGKKMGINYIGMEVTDQVRKREKMAKLGEDIAVRKAMESELKKTIHITEEMMNAKKMLARMPGEIRSPLLRIVRLAERFSSITKLDEEERRLLNEMISSAGLALERINEFLDLSEVESG
ncbi:Histidine kinase 5 [Raphanus sativus]|nr:Histidine kinase 5 [Raphanus sativus]